MFGYIVRRVISGLLVLLVVSMSVFALFFYGPANPALAYCPETRCTPAAPGADHRRASASTSPSSSSTART